MAYIINSENKDAIAVKNTGSGILVGKVKRLNTANKAEALDDIECREVTVIALKANEESVYVGGSDVGNESFGVELRANEAFTFNVENCKMIYVSAAAEGEGVSYVAI